MPGMRRGRLPVSLCTKRGSTKGLGRVRQKDRKSGDHASYKISVLSIVWLPFQPLVSIVFKLPLLLLLSRFSRVRLCATHRRQPTRLPCPWDSPGKNTGVGCHVLLQCMKVKSESEVAQSCPTLSDPMDFSPPGSSIHGILQARAS